MSQSDIKTITLRINSDDAAKKLEQLRQNIERANAARQQSQALEQRINSEIERATLERHKLDAAIKSGRLSQREENEALRKRNKLTEEIAQKEKALAAAKAETNKQAKAEAKNTKALERTQSQYQALERTLNNLGKATVPELKAAIRTLERTLNSGAVERGTEEWETFTKQIKECREELKELEDETRTAQKGVGTSIAKFGEKWNGIVGVVNMGSETVGKVYNWMNDRVQAYAEMNEHLSDVQKYTGLGREAVEQLNEAFQQMDTRTPREQLNALAADAGLLGIQGKEQVMEFVEDGHATAKVARRLLIVT